MEENGTTTAAVSANPVKRPFLLTLLCLFSYVFFGLIALIYLLAIVFSGTLADMVLRYAPEKYGTPSLVFVYSLGGFLLHTFSFLGILLMWKMKKLGYMFFGISSLIISSYQVFASRISPLTTAVYIFLLIAFGLFIKKLR